MLTGAIGVLTRPPNSSHSAAVLVREDVAQLAPELAVAPGVVGVLGAGPALEEVHAVDALAEVLPEGLLRGHEQDVAPSEAS